MAMIISGGKSDLGKDKLPSTRSLMGLNLRSHQWYPRLRVCAALIKIPFLDLFLVPGTKIRRMQESKKIQRVSEIKKIK